MVKYQVSDLDATFGALSDPIRRSILERLTHEESSVTALAEPFNISLPAISKHVKVLGKAGLVTQERDGRVRRCNLAAGPMKNASDWIARFRRLWEGQFDSLAEHLDQLQRNQSQELD